MERDWDSQVLFLRPTIGSLMGRLSWPAKISSVQFIWDTVVFIIWQDVLVEDLTKVSTVVAAVKHLRLLIISYSNAIPHRIKRHDNLVNYLQKIIQDRNHTVHKEPIFKVNNTKLKPDLVIYNPERTVLLDVQIVNDQFPLSTAHQNKVRKYECLREQLQNLRPGGYHGTTLTLNWRGVVCGQSSKELLALRIIKKGDLKIFSSRVLLGGIMAHYAHQRMTVSLRRSQKRGIGWV